MQLEARHKFHVALVQTYWFHNFLPQNITKLCLKIRHTEDEGAITDKYRRSSHSVAIQFRYTNKTTKDISEDACAELHSQHDEVNMKPAATTKEKLQTVEKLRLQSCPEETFKSDNQPNIENAENKYSAEEPVHEIKSPRDIDIKSKTGSCRDKNIENILSQSAKSTKISNNSSSQKTQFTTEQPIQKETLEKDHGRSTKNGNGYANDEAKKPAVTRGKDNNFEIKNAESNTQEAANQSLRTMQLFSAISEPVTSQPKDNDVIDAGKIPIPTRFNSETSADTDYMVQSEGGIANKSSEIQHCLPKSSSRKTDNDKTSNVSAVEWNNDNIQARQANKKHYHSNVNAKAEKSRQSTIKSAHQSKKVTRKEFQSHSSTMDTPLALKQQNQDAITENRDKLKYTYTDDQDSDQNIEMDVNKENKLSYTGGNNNGPTVAQQYTVQESINTITPKKSMHENDNNSITLACIRGKQKKSSSKLPDNEDIIVDEVKSENNTMRHVQQKQRRKGISYTDTQTNPTDPNSDATKESKIIDHSNDFHENNSRMVKPEKITSSDSEAAKPSKNTECEEQSPTDKNVWQVSEHGQNTKVIGANRAKFFQRMKSMELATASATGKDKSVQKIIPQPKTKRSVSVPAKPKWEMTYMQRNIQPFRTNAIGGENNRLNPNQLQSLHMMQRTY